MSSENNSQLLRYGELLMRKIRDEITSDELVEMEEIRKELSLTNEQIIEEVESLIKKNY